MELFPAIDISGGQAVRLRQGNYQKKQVYHNDPVSVARLFLAQGARNLHVVDLDGAKEGKAQNLQLLRAICEVKGLFVQIGGGIRDEESVETCLSLGAGRVILGTAAIADFSFLVAMIKKYGSRIAVSVDARDEHIATHGWQTVTKTDALTFCRKLRDAGVKTVIYTDISKDGELSGTNLAAYQKLRNLPELDIIASGGISFEQEIVALRDRRTYGAIIGKALYESRLSLPKILALADGKESS